MAERDLGKLDLSSDKHSDFSVVVASTDGAIDQPETTYENPNWAQYLGYYQKIPELKKAIDTKATWTVGKGYTADAITTLILDEIKGFGKDTFNTILENMIRVYHIGGDAFAEIITNEKGFLINLKPLDPGSMIIIANREGRIKRYEQKTKVKAAPNKRFAKEDIFHLARNRLADEIHGTSVITAMEEIILMRNEAMTDWRRVLHRNIDPMMIFHLDTDNTVKIAKFKAKMDEARGKGENIYIPKGAVELDPWTTSPNATMNPLPWIDLLNDYFYDGVGVPKVVIGNSKNFTEASAKIVYLAFQQTVEGEQLFVEENVLSQLNLEINLEFPVSLENEALSNKPKVEDRGIEEEEAIQQNDTTAEVEGNK